MKKITLSLIALMFIPMLCCTVKAQHSGNGNVTTTDRQVGSFEGIDVGSAINLVIAQGSGYKVKVETDENLQDKITTKVKDGILVLSCDKIRKTTKLNVFVTLPELKSLDASGASNVKGETSFKTGNFMLDCSGASEVELDITANTLNSDISGASDVNLKLSANELKMDGSGASTIELSGKVTILDLVLSGAATLKSENMASDKVKAELSGASHCNVNAKKQLEVDLSGASSISYLENGKKKKLDKSGKMEFTINNLN